MASSNLSRLILTLLLIANCPNYAYTQTTEPRPSNLQNDTNNTAEVLKKLDQLVEQNKLLEKENRELVDQIEILRGVLASEASKAPDLKEKNSEPVSGRPAVATASQQVQQVQEDDADSGLSVSPSREVRKTFGTYTPNLGFTVADTESGSLNVSAFSYVRYLNQLNLNPTYINAFGTVLNVKQRQDFQLAKVQVKFLGWLFNPSFRYLFYVWTSNANMGQGAQVVVAGNLNYAFNKHFTLSGGINALPGTRSVEGNFPYWLGEDTRLIADEFFRPSYTTGIWARGQITDRLRYHVMLGNNLSQLGINAGQLQNFFSTYSTAIIWMPTTGEFGPGFGDFEDHQALATRLATHYSQSREDRQEQPDTEGFQNTQLRPSDGSIIFTPNLFGPGILITDATYKMADFDGGIKYHGFSLEGEYYWRWLTGFRGPGTAGLPNLFDHGFQLQTSAMLVPKTVQLYAGGSTVFGQFGKPWDARVGINLFPKKNRVVRWNNEGLYLFNSPVGYLAVPFPVGGHGFVFHSNFEVAF